MRAVNKTYSDKILFPDSGISKGDLIRYYNEIADYILPYLKDRPLTMHRFPNGISNKGFFQKNASGYFPDWIKREKIRKEGGWVNHVICNNKETLNYLAGQGTICFHVTLSRIDKLDYPDKMIFDLDPPDSNFKTVLKCADALRGFLESELQLSTFPMLTGSRGIHLVVPLLRVESFDEVRNFAKNVAAYMVEKYPEDFTVEFRKNRRHGRLFLDYLRNSYAQTAVCPFSIRALENAPLAVPVSWDELDNIPRSSAYNIHTIFDKLKKHPDPWENFGKKAGILSNAKKRFEKISGAKAENVEVSLNNKS